MTYIRVYHIWEVAIMVARKSVALCIFFYFITCGLYGLYWFVCLTNDTNTVAKRADTSGGMALLFEIITCGLYGFYWAYKCGEKIDAAKQERGQFAANSGVLYLLVYLFGGVISYALIQHEVNQLA